MDEITAEGLAQAKLALAGLFGAILFVFWRKPETPQRAAMILFIGVGNALVFATEATMLMGWAAGKFLGIEYIPSELLVGALLGLTGISVTKHILTFVENFDISKIKIGGKA